MSNQIKDEGVGTFEMSVRILGNEFVGFKISVDDIKTKWITVSILAVGALTFFVSKVGPAVIAMFESLAS